MKPFAYERPDTLTEAARLMQEAGEQARLSAGGTDILGVIRSQIHKDPPELLVSLKGIPGLDQIIVEPERVRIGAMTRLEQLQNDKTIAQRLPLLAEAAHAVASPQLRHMATIGGNICQEPRCWYYRYPNDKFHCFRKGGTVCPALPGNNKIHSIFGAARVCATPCESGCPNGNPIPAYMERLREQDVDGAAALLFQANPLAAVTGRVCTHNCQEECSRGQFDHRVSIRQVERFLGDYILDHAPAYYGGPAPASGKRAAIIGSGPAGLTAAYFLARQGHGVTVFEQNSRPGGMLTYGIPAYRLPKDIVSRTVEAIGAMGVEFRLNTRIGRDIALSELLEGYDAVFAAIGAWVPVKPPCPGTEARGVLTALDLLRLAAEKQPVELGRRVVVIGGGSVAMDAALTARRLGAAQVRVVALESREQLPADPDEVTWAEEEGVELILSQGVERVLEEGGQVRGLLLKACLSVFDSRGCFAPVYDESLCQELAADTVIFAIGQGIDASGFPGLPLTSRQGLAADSATCATAIPGLFAGGDGAFGPSTVVRAIADGRKAAAAIQDYLGVREQPPQAAPETLRRFDPSCGQPAPALGLDIKEAAQRTLYQEDCATPAREAVLAEARRCYNCGCVAANPSDLAPALIALEAMMITTKRAVPAEAFFRAAIGSGTILERDELVREISIPLLPRPTVQVYHKFRLRKSIDFPLVALAACFELTEGRISRSRLVLNAVSPLPYRLERVEELLAGQAPDDDLARRAAALAVADALPLAEDRYKVNVAAALVRRAVAALCKDIK